MATREFFIKQNDLKPELQGTITDADGAAVDVTGLSLVFSMYRRGKRDQVAVSRQTVALVTAASGIVKYTWATGDTKGSGEFIGEFEVVTGGPETFPNNRDNKLLIHVEPQGG